MDKWSGGRKVLVGALLVTLLAAIVIVALPSRGIEAASNCTYYSNAAHTTVVGQFGYDCCNNPVAWGRKTAYKVCGGCFPCVPPPR